MTAGKSWFAVPALGIVASLGLGVAAWAGGVFGLPYDTAGGAELSTTTGVQAPSPSPSPLEETALGTFRSSPASETRSIADRIRDKYRSSATDPNVNEGVTENQVASEGPAGSTESPSSGSATAVPTPANPGPESAPAPAFTPWKTVTDTWEASTGGFCAGLNSLRTGAGVPALASCIEDPHAVAWAQQMALTGSLGHDPTYSGSEVVGYSWEVDRILNGPSGFPNSPAHMAIITAGGEDVTVHIGCYWMRQQEQQRANGPVHTLEYVYCVARFQ